jgi:hypothetical protein
MYIVVESPLLYYSIQEENSMASGQLRLKEGLKQTGERPSTYVIIPHGRLVEA